MSINKENNDVNTNPEAESEEALNDQKTTTPRQSPFLERAVQRYLANMEEEVMPPAVSGKTTGALWAALVFLFLICVAIFDLTQLSDLIFDASSKAGENRQAGLIEPIVEATSFAYLSVSGKCTGRSLERNVKE